MTGRRVVVHDGQIDILDYLDELDELAADAQGGPDA